MINVLTDALKQELKLVMTSVSIVVYANKAITNSTKSFALGVILLAQLVLGRT